MAGPSTLTVLLVPSVHAAEALSVLGDYAEAGLLASYAWIDSAAVCDGTMSATLVRDGSHQPVALTQLLTAQRFDRVRLAVLVPVQASAEARVTLNAQQALEQTVRSSAIGADVTLLRLLLTTDPTASVEPDPTLTLEGWHNVLVCPEDSPAPGLGSTVISDFSDPVDVARLIAPTICGVAGMWAGIETTPFDTLDILPGQTIRAVRAFYRQLDTAAVEEQIRAELFGPSGRLPLPNGGQFPVVYIDDTRLAAQSMARALWTKHRDVLRGPRVLVEKSGAQAISIWSALRMFLRFLGGALRRAPGAWMSSALGSVSSAVAATVQSTVFGRTDSAFAVVAERGAPGWQELGRSADELSSALPPGDDHLSRPNLAALWADFVNGALTLADGGRRDASMEPVRVGAAVGVMRDCANVAPGDGEQFAAIPASLAAVIGIQSVGPADVLGAMTLREQLRRVYGDPAAGVEARHTAAELDHWQAAVSTSYTWQAAAILADFVGRARAEVTTLVEQIRSITNAESANERLRRRQRTVGLILKTFGWALFVALAVLAGAAGVHWLSWRFGLTCGGALVGIYLVMAFALFLFVQRDMFAEIHLRESRRGQLEAMQTNLRTALRDLSRVAMAYGQLLSWSRVVGALLRAPFGELSPADTSRTPLIDGLPRSTQVAKAVPSPEQADAALHQIERRLYRLGWLTHPWQQLLTAAAAELRDEPSVLLAMPGIGTGSALDRWSVDVAAGKVTAAGADALWEGVQQMFDTDAGTVGDDLTGTVVLGNGTASPAAEFGAGMTGRRSAPAAPFDGSLFSHAALTAGRSAVAIDDSVVKRCGLGYRAVVIQASDGLPTYDFSMCAPNTAVPSTSPSTIDDDPPPNYPELVF
jgi:hypothetical protein